MATKQMSPKRFTFTFSNSAGLGDVIRSLESLLKGMNRAEIVKLALIEFNKILLKREMVSEYVEILSEKDEASLAEAMKSECVRVNMSKKGELRRVLDEAKIKYA